MRSRILIHRLDCMSSSQFIHEVFLPVKQFRKMLKKGWVKSIIGRVSVRYTGVYQKKIVLILEKKG